MKTKETYTPGYSDVAIRYMKRRHAARDAAFLLPLLKPGMRLLDCGCGPATITVGLAEAVAPGPVTAIDVEPGQVELARETARAKGADNVTVKQASIYDLPVADGSFDAVFSHALFEHLADPPAALREIRRVLGPGGLAGIASPDWDGIAYAPHDAEVDEAVALYTTLQSRNGGNPFRGRELGGFLKDAGFSEIRLTATYDNYERVSLITDLLADRIGAWHSDRATVSRLTAALARWASQPLALFAQSFVCAVGRAAK